MLIESIYYLFIFIYLLKINVFILNNMAAASSTPVFCFSSGKDLTKFPKSRKNILGEAFNSSLPEWKRLVVLRFKEIGYGDIDVDTLIKDEKFNGKCCRMCTAALRRLGKLQLSCYDKMKKGVDCMISSDWWQSQESRKRSFSALEDDDSNEDKQEDGEDQRSNNQGTSTVSRTQLSVSLPHTKEQSKDVVAVCFILQNIYINIILSLYT